MARRGFLLTTLALIASSAPWLGAGRADDPIPADDDRQYERELAERTFRDNCLMCHSAEMTEAQRMTAAQWDAEVEKMVAWGAPVPPEERPRLVAHLASEYGAERPPAESARMLSAEIRILKRSAESPAPAGDAGAGAPLYATHCANCHAADARGGDLGTNLVLNPVLLGPAAFGEVVRNGRHRMPGFAEVLGEEQEGHILAWLREQRYPATD